LIMAGSGTALAFFPRYFNKGDLVTADQTFGILPGTAKRIGTKVKEIPLTQQKVHDLDAMLRAIDNETAMVYICNPANPTGTILKPAALKSFCEEATRKTVVIIDEAYIDFVEGPDNESMIGLISQNPNLLIVRTFSKIHGMAGLRVGFVIGHPDLIKKLDTNYFLNTQINVSDLSQAAAQASLKDEIHRKLSREKNAEARKYTIDKLTRMNFHCFPSYTNFLYFNLNNYSGDFGDDMLKKEIVLRSGEYAGTKFVRVSIGTLEEMQRFIKVMKTTFNS